MNARSSAPSRDGSSPEAWVDLPTALTLLGIAVATFGVVSWLTRPSEDLSGMPVTPPSATEPTSAVRRPTPARPSPRKMTLFPGGFRWDAQSRRQRFGAARCHHSSQSWENLLEASPQ